jgi:hypothetical protein
MNSGFMEVARKLLIDILISPDEGILYLSRKMLQQNSAVSVFAHLLRIFSS